MAFIAVRKRSITQHPITARVSFDSGCPICSSVQFLYDFTAGLKKVSQCAGCGLVRFDNRSGSDPAGMPPQTNEPSKNSVPQEFTLAAPLRELITYVSAVYAHG